MSGWSKSQARKFARDAKATIGRDGWKLLVPELREAVIAAAALGVVRQQLAPHGGATATVAVNDIDALVMLMLAEAGL